MDDQARSEAGALEFACRSSQRLHAPDISDSMMELPVSMPLGIAESYRDVLEKCGHLTDHVIRLLNLSRTRAEPGPAGARAMTELETWAKIIADDLKEAEEVVALLKGGL
jgi:hypothetical protein